MDDVGEDSGVVVEAVSAEHLLAGALGRRIIEGSSLVASIDDDWESGLVVHLDSGAAFAIVERA